MSKTLLVLGEKYYLNLLVKYICNAHAMYQYYARLSNSFFAILVEGGGRGGSKKIGLYKVKIRLRGGGGGGKK